MKLWTPEQQVLAKQAEFWRTPEWPIEAILRVELLTARVFDPCCGDGAMTDIARRHGYEVIASDLYDWGIGEAGVDFLTTPEGGRTHGHTIFMNPPFSKACDFVERGMALGARKIVCFQRWAWWESAGRRAWWEAHRPQRIYVCSDRATCWLGTIPEEEKIDEKGRRRGTSNAHGWFIWESGQPTGPLIGHISKDMAA